ncbi:MAG: NIPSNAP family containing protein [Draconibacterium sp.]|nr:NIPSNAP family containing protein [Draconibacterium sp.]
MTFSKKLFTRSFLLLLFIATFTLSSTLSARDYYQIKVYNIKDKSQESQVENYLENAYLPAMHRAGVKKVGVFKPIADDAAAGTKIFVFIPLKDLNQVEKIEAKLKKDDKFQKDGADYINASWENPPYERIESILIKAFAKMPKFSVPNHTTAASEQIYELRSYEGPTEKMYQKKVEMFNDGGEVAIFNGLDFQEVFYGEVISGSAMPNLMYMTTFANMKTHDEHWDAFRAHPDWLKLKEVAKYKHTVSGSTKYLMHPTDYSDI